MSHSNAHGLLASTASRIEGAYAPSTIRAYRSDFAEFIGFCERKNLEVFPPDPLTLSEFIAYVSEKGRSSATIRRAIARISTIYRLNRMPDPSKDPEVIIAMKRMHRKLGRASSQAQAITANVLEKLLATIGNTDRGTRDRALLLIAYDTLCRRSELVYYKFRTLNLLKRMAKNIRPSCYDAVKLIKNLPAAGYI